MIYEESSLWDVIGITPYTIESYFRFSCKAMPWANNRIRVQYYGAVGQRMWGRTWNSSQVGDDFDKDLDWDKAGTEDKPGEIKSYNSTETFWIKRVSFYKNGCNFKIGPVFNGMNTMFIIFTTL
jgi:hypothetical protein